jgi:type IV secretory pathway VirB10-like protein
LRDVSLSAQKFDDFEEERAAPKRRAPSPARAKMNEPRNGPAKKRRLGAMALFGIGGLALVGVPMNALFFQDGRHPAPLFSAHVLVPEKPVTAEAPTPPARPKIETARVEAEAPSRPAAKPRAESAKVDPLAEILKSSEPPAAKPQKAERVEKVEKVEKIEKKREVASRDQIGALLGGGAPKPAAPVPVSAPAASAATAASSGNVLATQRALQRLGYVVKPDGVMSPGLKKAIQSFERDNGMPVTGELSVKLGKAITARAGGARP